MGDVIRRKIIRCRILIVLCSLAFMGGGLWCLWQYELKNADVGMVRVYANQLLSDLEAGKDVSRRKYPDPYVVYNLKGQVLYSTM